MAPDEYSTGGGGKLKLKGSKVADGRVEKKKKKKGLKKKAEAEAAEAEAGDDKKKSAEVDEDQHQDDERESRNKSRSPDERDERDFGPKTETERKYEEVRRKRVCDVISCSIFFSLYFPFSFLSRGE